MKRLMTMVLIGILGNTALAGPKEKNMVVEYIRYEVPAARHDEFLAAYTSAAEELESSSHCVGYEISEGIEEPDDVTVRIEWDSLEQRREVGSHVVRVDGWDGAVKSPSRG